MNTQIPPRSLEMEQLPDQVSQRPPDMPRYTGMGRIALCTPKDRQSFRARLECLLHALDVPDVRHDVSMKEFLKWRMQVLWFLNRYLGGGHPYTAEFLLTVEREADPHSNGRFVIAGQAILEALRSDFDDGFLTDED